MADPLDASAIFVAPHLDDVALSCGGTVARHASRGVRPLIVTVAAGLPDSGKDAEGDAAYVMRRRREDAAAAAALGASTRWLPHLDAIYRGYGAAIFAGRRPESDLADRIGDDLEQVWRESGAGSVFLPLGIGNHVDHQLCASLHERLRKAGAVVWHYEDTPYVLRWTAAERWMNGMELGPLRAAVRPYLEERLLAMGLVASVVEVTDQMTSRLAAIDCYVSQLPGLFPRRNQQALIRDYAASLTSKSHVYGERFWTFPC